MGGGEGGGEEKDGIPELNETSHALRGIAFNFGQLNQQMGIEMVIGARYDGQIACAVPPICFSTRSLGRCMQKSAVDLDA